MAGCTCGSAGPIAPLSAPISAGGAGAAPEAPLPIAPSKPASTTQSDAPARAAGGGAPATPVSLPTAAGGAGSIDPRVRQKTWDLTALPANAKRVPGAWSIDVGGGINIKVDANTGEIKNRSFPRSAPIDRARAQQVLNAATAGAPKTEAEARARGYVQKTPTHWDLPHNLRNPGFDVSQPHGLMIQGGKVTGAIYYANGEAAPTDKGLPDLGMGSWHDHNEYGQTKGMMKMTHIMFTGNIDTAFEGHSHM